MAGENDTYTYSAMLYQVFRLLDWFRRPLDCGVTIEAWSDLCGTAGGITGYLGPIHTAGYGLRESTYFCFPAGRLLRASLDPEDKFVGMGCHAYRQEYVAMVLGRCEVRNIHTADLS
jgi:hypothetical protein